MAIIHNEIPSDLLVPGGYIEFDSRLAGTLSDQSSILVVGEKLKAASAGMNSINRIQTEAQAIEQFGENSMLHDMLKLILTYNYGSEIYAVAVEDEDSVEPLDLSAMITAMDEDRYDYLLCPYHEADTLATLRTECDRRWHAMQAVETHVFCVSNNSFNDLDELTKNLNSSHFTFLPVKGTEQTLHIWLAVLGAIAADQLSNDPAAPLTDVELPELTVTETYSKREMNDMLHSGLSTHRVVGGKVQISYLVTTYRYNAQGENDTAYRDIQVPEILKNLRRRQIYEVMKKFAGYKLAKDASQYAAGQKVVDPAEIAGFLYALYLDTFMREYCWVQDAPTYLNSLIVEISPDNNDRVNYIDSPSLIGQFRVFAGQSQFIDR